MRGIIAKTWVKMKEEIQFILDVSERIFAKNIDHKIRLDL